MTEAIPFCDVGWQYLELGDEAEREVREVLETGRYIRGSAVRDFEAAVQSYLEKPYPPLGHIHAVAVASGTDALVIALKAAGVAAGDEVIMPSLTFVATAHAARRIGAHPVFVDVDAETLCIDVDAAASAIGARTTAIVPVHLYGAMADMDGLSKLREKHGVVVIEDAAQAFGAEHSLGKAGAIGDVGCFSFFPTKPLGACGDGGMVVTHSPQLHDRVDSLRRQGFAGKNRAVTLGLNSRLDALQAVILARKLTHLDEWQKQRAAVASQYMDGFADIRADDDLSPPSSMGNIHAWHLYVVQVAERDAFQEHLASLGVPTIVHYDPPVHLQPYYGGERHSRRTDLTYTETVAPTLCSLPLWAGMPDGDVDRVIAAVRSYYER